MSEAYITVINSLNECWFDMSPYGCPTTLKLIIAIGMAGLLMVILGSILKKNEKNKIKITKKEQEIEGKIVKEVF